MFDVGYKHIRERVEKANRFIISCENCAFFRQDTEDGDDEEYCQNAGVTSYDMIVDGNRVSCLQWVSYSHADKIREE